MSFSRVPPVQPWTIDGYPIVDNKYHDLATGEIKEHPPGKFFTSGPPTLAIYWHNRQLSHPDPKQQFYGVSTTASGINLSEYLARVGELLKEGKVKIDSINGTRYSVNIIVETGLSRDEFGAAMDRFRLQYVSEPLENLVKET